MKLLILDDKRGRRKELSDALQTKRSDVKMIHGSNEFIEAVEKGTYDLLLMDMKAWYRGRPIYERFGIAKKLANTPVLFYDAPPTFTALEGRSRHAKDRILPLPTETASIVASVQENR
ncbi:MAG: response regulator [Chitinispirillaceae bacterium]|nr:response regulator [Chitinispirillaceae bacterium]